MRSINDALAYMAIATVLSACDGRWSPGGADHDSSRPATETTNGSDITREDACASLSGLHLIDLRLTASEHVPAGADTPMHCRVMGVIETEINFELLLPDEWNGRFVMGGGGGFVGSVQNQALGIFRTVGGDALSRGFATVGTDTGHDGEGIEAAWALDHPERQENFGHRAVHLTAETAKSILRHYYGEPEQYAYFLGCSRGGGQAMMESQRYPDDFDGLVAAAPAYHWTGIGAQFIHTQQGIYPTGALSAPVITPDNLTLLADSIDVACDTLDGVDDDIVTDPRLCGFDPKDLPRCDTTAHAGCVTDVQHAAIQRVYDGPTRDGEPLYFGFPFGGENDPGGWDSWVVGADEVRERGAPSLHYAFGTELYKYFVFGDPEWDYTTYDFSNWSEDTAATAEMLNATDADLGPFRDGGGKIIFWTGWSDLALSPLGTIDYYEQLTSADPAAEEYARLYMLPGVLHCGGGPGPDQVDWLGALQAWVEEDEAPDRLLAERFDDTGEVTLSRPVCPYPQVSQYRGEGDTSIETSFVCASPD